MKKRYIEVLAILIISMGGALLLPNFFKYNPTIEWPNLETFLEWTIAISFVLSILVYINKPKEKLPSLPDGYNELYNTKNQITKKGMFIGGRQISGTKNIYKKDGNFSHIETCKNGIYTKENSKSR